MLRLKSLITPSAMLAAFTLTAAPSFAQDHNRERERSAGQQSGSGSTERAQPRREAPAQSAPAQTPAPRAEQRRQEAPRVESPQAPQSPRGENRRDERADNRRNDVVGRAVPRREVIAPRSYNAPRDESRGYDSRGYDYRGYGSRGYESRGYDSRYAPRYYAPRGYVGRSYYRPYVFRPRLSIGFGIFSGYPVPYNYGYEYPIEVYGYGAPRERVSITPGSSYYGGVALEITPNDADVYVDGEYAGRVEDFDGTTQPLTLTSGTHRIEVQAQGYEPMIVDVGIQAGQVVPYRGDLRRY